jgi:tetratricopeptide (TPR) repeat protein
LRNSIILLFILAVVPAWASSGPELLLKGIEHYEFAEFDQAQKALSLALKKGDLSASLKAKAHAYQGLVYLAKGNEKKALNAFSQAKTDDPSYKLDPNRYKPRAVQLFNKARAKGKKAEEKPKSSQLSQRGYVLEITKSGEVTLDLGSSQGVKAGDRFEVVNEKVLKHPVTGKNITRRRTVGAVQVYEVNKDLSFAKLVSGGKRVKVGSKLVKIADAGKTDTTAQTAPTGRLKVAVMQPMVSHMGDSDNFFRSDYKAHALAQGLSAKGLFETMVPSSSQMNKAVQVTGYRPGSYRLGKRLGLPSLTLNNIKDMKVLEVLTPKQVEVMAKAMDMLGVNAILVWDVTLEDDSDQVRLSVNLHLRGQNDPKVRDSDQVLDFEAPKKYVQIITELVEEGLRGN